MLHSRSRLLPVLILLAASLTLVSCQRTQGLSTQARDAWASIISAHTTGVVSRRTEIRVLFNSDVAPDNASHPLDARSILSISPAVAGEIRFRGPRELALKPSSELAVGQTYTVRVKARGLAGLSQNIEPYEFKFSVQSPQYEVDLQELMTDPADDRRMVLRGTVTTADTESAARVEQLIRVSYLSKPQTATWTHSSNGLVHTFTVAGLERQLKATPVDIAADGQAIGATDRHTYQVEVPASGEFKVINALAIEQDGRRQIQVVFSDSLDERQSLRGLVRLSIGAFTTRVDGNMLLLYPKEEIEGEVTVNLEQGLRNRRGVALAVAEARTLEFSSEGPQVRFVGNGVILPDGKTLTVPFEAINARSVRVIATRIYPESITQFLQVNRLDGSDELGRVGRYLWRKTLPLPGPAGRRWNRYALDVTELIKKYPGSMFQLTLQLTPADSAYRCAGGSDGDAASTVQAPLRDQEDGDSPQPSAWDYAEDFFGIAGEESGFRGARWSERNDPCKRAYFVYNNLTHAQHNLLASNIGLLAKADQRGRLLVTVTDLRTAQPMSNVALSVRNFQNQVLVSGKSDAKGMARLEPTGTPFLLVAETVGGKGYLKLNVGNALPVSHFDVGGEVVSKGLKGTIYGERGVWHPGDDIHLTFVVHDPEHTLPAEHPATLELLDPRGRVTATLVNAAPVDGFYRFDTRTRDDAVTGDWTAKVVLGGVSFSKKLKIETVMPNRLKVELKFPATTLGAGRPIRGSIASQWLSGASAAGLKTDVSLRLTPGVTHFQRYNDFVFDDPAREFASEPEKIYEGALDAKGGAEFQRSVELASPPPGMLTANFTTRVFERGGAFSIMRDSADYAPFARFVGLRLPKGDAARGMLQTDQDHIVEVASVTAVGQPLALSRIRVTLYKIDWRWWWEKGGESLSRFVESRGSSVVSETTLATDASGHAQWKLRVNYPQWGRYMLRACDEEGGHCSGSTFYIDWPSWAGKGRDQSGPAATMLSLTTDKPSYQVGETATIQLPESAQGRALLTVENGSGVLDARWIEPRTGNTRVTVPITATMTPNVYVAVTLVQPHEGKDNDRPIRLYGVVPLEVTDPQTHIKPVIQAPQEWQPESQPTVRISEADGKAMTYTIAVVDEGLLSLTNFKTPDLFQQFYKREALGVKTWDLFDDVIGAYGAELERLLALGGSDGNRNAENQSQSRFPPVVQVLGPFRLKAGATAAHVLTLGRYVGAVRVMVVAGNNAVTPAAFGSAEKSVFVRKPLMILPTMPRVVGPGESIDVPVSVFAGTPAVKNVSLSIQPDSLFIIEGEAATTLTFTQPGEKMGMLRLKAGERLGHSTVKFSASSGEQRASDSINIEIRSANPPTTRMQSKVLQPGESWTAQVKPHGIEGTNQIALDVSALPPLNLASRMGFLVQYPYGCLEQVTSAAFPQLFLPSLLHLDDARRRETEDNIRAAIDRLRSFQLGNGGFSYWPGGSSSGRGASEGYSLWATTYASHFLVEAEKTGYAVPTSMRAGMIRALRTTAQDWRASQGSPLDQAYRLYVLARAGQPELGAMNRLRETGGLQNTERWVLAASYQLAGLRDVARTLTPSDAMSTRSYRGADYTFGSVLRDRAMILQSMVVLGRQDLSQGVSKAIAYELASDDWYSTQSVSYALMAMAQLAGAGSDAPYTFERSVAGKRLAVTGQSPVYQEVLAGVTQSGTAVTVHNTSQRILFADIAVRGTSLAGHEDAESSGLALAVHYSDEAGNALDVTRLRQGTDVRINLEVHNTSGTTLNNIALTQILPAGWEIQNERLEGSKDENQRDGGRRAPGGEAAARAPAGGKADYTDIRDDRVLRYFSLQPDETIRFTTRVNAAYRGRFYLPSVVAEAMYDAGHHARTSGQWSEVVSTP